MQRKLFITASFSLILVVAFCKAMEEENETVSRLWPHYDIQDSYLETNQEKDQPPFTGEVGNNQPFLLYQTSPTNHEDFINQRAASCIKKAHEKFDQKTLEKLIDDAPKPLQRFVKSLKLRLTSETPFKKKRIDQSIITLVGPPGVGKTSLANAIPQYCKTLYTPIECPNLSDEYTRSGQSILNKIVKQVLTIKNPHFIVLDEIEAIICHDGAKNNNDVAKTLWLLLDDIERTNNIFLIATSNELDELPKQIRQRICSGCYKINIPDFNYRKKTLNFNINLFSSEMQITVTPQEIDSLAKQTNGLTHRDLYKIFKESIQFVDQEEENLAISYKELLKAITFVKQNNGTYKSWNTQAYEFIKPAIVPALQILIPTITNCAFSYFIIHIQNKKMQQTLHDATQKLTLQIHRDNLAQAEKSALQSEKFHNEGLTQAKTSHTQNMQQAKNFHNEQMESNYIQMACDAGIVAAGTLKDVYPDAAITIG